MGTFRLWAHPHHHHPHHVSLLLLPLEAQYDPSPRWLLIRCINVSDFLFLSVGPSVCLFTCLSSCLSTCLPVCLLVPVIDSPLRFNSSSILWAPRDLKGSSLGGPLVFIQSPVSLHHSISVTSCKAIVYSSELAQFVSEIFSLLINGSRVRYPTFVTGGGGGS